MNEPRLARWIRWLIYLATAIPLVIFSQYISPFHFGKVILFRAIVEVMAALFLLLIWREPSYRPKSHPLTWAFLGLVGAFTLTTITSVAPIQSFWGTLERMGGLFTFWHYFIFYLITVSVLRTRRDWQTLIDLVVATGVASALYGFLQRTGWSGILGSGGRERIFGTIGNPALFAGYQILVAYLAATFFLMKKTGPSLPAAPRTSERGWIAFGVGILLTLLTAAIFNGQGLWNIPLGLTFYGIYLVASGIGGPRVARWCYGIAAGLTLLAAALTVVRGSLLAIGVASIVFAMLWSSVFKSRKGKLALVMLLACAVVFFFAAITLRNTSLVRNSAYLSRVTDFSASTTTVQTRFWAWSAGFKGWLDSPQHTALGWGPENFNVPFSKYFNPKFFTGPGAETFFDRAHNMFIEVLVTMGLVGELAYLTLFGVLFWTLGKLMRRDGDERVLGIGFTALTIAYMIHNSFIFDTSANFITFFIILAVTTHTAQHGLEPAESDQRKSVRLRPWTFAQVGSAVILAIVATTMIWKTDVVAAKANYTTTRAIVAGYQGNFASAASQFQAAIDYNVAGKYEYRTRFGQFLLELAGATDASKIPTYTTMSLQAIEDIKQDVQDNPSDYLPLLYIARLYSTLGSKDATSQYNDLSLEYSNRALIISPTFVRTYYEIGQAYLNKHDYPKALEAFKKAADLNPDVGLTWWYVAIVEFQVNDNKAGLEDASKALSDGYTPSEADATKLATVYTQVGDYATAIRLYESVTKNAPDNAEDWVQLAVLYARVNRIQDATAATRKAMALNPNDAAFQAQAQAFLRSIGVTP